MNLNKILLEILNYYNINLIKGIPYLEELDYLRNLDEVTLENFIFPYAFVHDYNFLSFNVRRDEGGFPYIFISKDSKVYFPKDWSDEKVKANFKLLLIEQDVESPHYFKPIPKDSDITLDIGCAEANFTLMNFPNSRKFHLFDIEEFHGVIHRTFKDNDNVIYHKGLLGVDDIIDNIKFDGKVDNMKIDVRGSEYEVLIGASRLIARDKPFIQVCTYHHKDDFEGIYTLLKSFGYENIKSSKGFMLYPNSSQKPPYFRKGVLYAKYE